MTRSARTFTPKRPTAPLPGTTVLGAPAYGLLELADSIERGFPPRAVTRLASHLHLTLETVLGILDLSSSTYRAQRRAGRQLSCSVSERLYELARLTEAAETYFESAEAARRWLGTPRRTFGDRSPLAFATLPGGAAYAELVLQRLEHGVYS